MPGAWTVLLGGLVLFLTALGPSAALAQLAQATEAPTPSGDQPGERPGSTPPVPPTEQEAPAPPERPFIERPPTPTERVLPQPAVTPRPTDVAPTPPGPTIPSVAAPPVLSSPLALGFLPTALFEIHPSISLSEEYSDNFQQDRVNPRSNFRSALTPGLTLLINSPFTKGVIAYSFGLSHDSTASDFDFGQFHSLLGSVTWEATPVLSLTLSDSLTHSDEPSQADRLSLRRGRTTFTSNTFTVEASYRLRSLTVHPYYRNTMFSDEGGDSTTSHALGTSVSLPLYTANTITAGYDYLDSTNVRGHQVQAAFSRQINPRTSAGVSAGLLVRETSGDSGNDDGAIDYQVWNAGLFASRTLSGRLTLDASLGVSKLITDQADRGDEGPFLSTASTLAYRFAAVTAVVGVDKGYSETFSGGQNLGVVKTQGATGSFSYAFSPAVSASVGAFYRENEFTGIAGGERDREETTWGGTVSALIKLRTWLDLSLLYTYTDRRDKTGEDSFKENLVEAVLRASF